MDGVAWWAMGHGVAKSWTQLSDFTHFWSLIMRHYENVLPQLLMPKVSLGVSTCPLLGQNNLQLRDTLSLCSLYIVMGELRLTVVDSDLRGISSVQFSRSVVSDSL